jgi:orotidine-5'-phosphate decarboxylase
VLGLDPDPGALWPGTEFAGSTEDAPNDRAAAGVLQHCRQAIDATAEACVAVKLQLARFELLGAPGWAVLEEVAAHARLRGLMVIADGKRGDIDVSAQAYARALFAGCETPFGRLPGLGAEMATVNPLMGLDAIAPFVVTAREAGAGVLVLVRTSNPGAADVEDLALAAGGAVWERIAEIVARLGEDAPQAPGETGLGDVGAVVGATEPAHLARARELMPHAVFLLPGVGAQGGRVEDLAPAFAPGRAGGLITASRSIVNAHLARENSAGVAGAAAAARAEAERLREQAWALSALAA